MNEKEKKRIEELLNQIRSIELDTDCFKLATDFEIIQCLLECAIIKMKERVDL